MDTRSTKRSVSDEFAVANREVARGLFADSALVWAGAKDHQHTLVAIILAVAIEVMKIEGTVQGGGSALRGFTLGCCGFNGWREAQTAISGYLASGAPHDTLSPPLIRVLDLIKFQTVDAVMKRKIAMELVVEATAILGVVNSDEAEGLRFLAGHLRACPGASILETTV
ncbi:hypothetical protein LTR17_024952 [Elasticomyces elasticus]|nr:hypothetical protein LTR17_024952 [Elasticomyces elasticus]